jgi:glycerol-3-phosphate acyltransferase PlsY
MRAWPGLQTLDSSMESALPILSGAIASCPTFIALGVGVVVSIARWRHHPRASMYALTAMALMGMATLVGHAFPSFAPQVSSDGSGGGVAFFAGGFLVTAVLDAVGLSLLIAAVFVDRTPSRER